MLIPDVPMVDQGQKGYCVVAATERALKHWEEHRGLSVDGPVMTG